MFIITDQQLSDFGQFIFLEKLLNLFHEINMPLSVEDKRQFKQNFSGMIAQANNYGFKTEKQIAVFIFSSWLMGLGFEQKFAMVSKTLNDHQLKPEQKMHWLSNWTATIFDTLESKS